MYSKEEVIHRIGEDKWEDFEIFILSRDVEYDDYGLELYYAGDVSDFIQYNTKY